jgi:stress response protein YsnF
VPVCREEVRLEREPITDANRGDAMSGRRHHRGRARSHLHGQRPVVSKKAVPWSGSLWRVRLGAETVTENHKVNETLRQEQIDEPGVTGKAKR